MVGINMLSVQTEYKYDYDNFVYEFYINPESEAFTAAFLRFLKWIDRSALLDMRNFQDLILAFNQWCIDPRTGISRWTYSQSQLNALEWEWNHLEGRLTQLQEQESIRKYFQEELPKPELRPMKEVIELTPQERILLRQQELKRMEIEQQITITAQDIQREKWREAYYRKVERREEYKAVFGSARYRMTYG